MSFCMVYFCSRLTLNEDEKVYIVYNGFAFYCFCDGTASL